MVEKGIFESIDKTANIGNIGEYEVKLKYNEKDKVVIDSIEKAKGIRVTYTLDPVGYTNQAKVNILFKVQGDIKSVTKPDGLEVYPQNDRLETNYEVNSNGVYKFIIEENGKEPKEKEVVVDTIDLLPPKPFTITAEGTRLGIKVTGIAEDAKANESSTKSGIERYEYYVKLTTQNEYTKYGTNEIELPIGTYKVYAVAYDKAGNHSENSNEVEVNVEEWIEIRTEQELRDISKGLNRNYVLMNDIVLQNKWEPLSTFTGKLDGGNYKISGLKIENPTSNNQGLFEIISDSGKVSNLKLDCNITGYDNVGGLAGINNGTIENIKITGVVTGRNAVGGLVGHNERGKITYTYSAATITGQLNNIGGLVGENWNATSIISKSASSGVVMQLGDSAEAVGGLVGSNFYAYINNSYSTGIVNGNCYVGGLVGNNNGAYITNSYSISKVIGNRNLGALVGIYGGGISNSYWTSEKSEIESGGIETDVAWKKTLEQMKTQSNYEGWDFETGTVWKMGEFPELVFSFSVEKAMESLIPKLTSNEECVDVISYKILNNYQDEWGRREIFYIFDRDYTTIGGCDGVYKEVNGAWIGYDFKTPERVSFVTGKIRMKSYKIQYSDDKENWQDALEKTLPQSNNGDVFANQLEDFGKHRYWRLYVNDGCDTYNWGSLIYDLQFYGIKE